MCLCFNNNRVSVKRIETHLLGRYAVYDILLECVHLLSITSPGIALLLH